MTSGMTNRWLFNLKERHLQGERPGVFAVCSAHPVVLQTAMETASAADQFLLVEATANQVNQFGGYSGMTPEAFVGRLHHLARQTGLPIERVLIGADHLGPHLWRAVPMDEAMARTRDLLRQCVAAGFDKIHLDTGAPCASDPGPPLPLETAARRAAELCATAEEVARALRPHAPPFYVIGNETPPPGGGLEADNDVTVTDPGQLDQALDAFERAFGRLGLAEAWQRVLAVVVQPGVEFGDRQVAAFQPEAAAALSAAHARLPDIMTYEVHATDYQTPEALRRLIDGHFTILKAGPCLTFALRCTLYALAAIEAALPDMDAPSHLIEVMERVMLDHPAHWQSHLRGSREDMYDLRHYSLRDRIRYYWSFPDAREAVARLLDNLRRQIPDELLKAHLPGLFPMIQAQGLHGDPMGMVKLSVRQALDGYVEACWR